MNAASSSLPSAEAAIPLPGIVARLIDMADVVGRESEAAAASVRAVTAHVHAAAELAGKLVLAAAAIEERAREQADALAGARVRLAEHEPSIAALAGSIGAVSDIAGAIARIAGQTQLLALNARIEAARAGGDGQGFAIVAREVSALSQQTRAAADDIGRSAAAVARDVGGAQRVVELGAELVRTQDAMTAAALGVAGDQRGAATALDATASGTAGLIDEAATGLGRIASGAVAVKLLARQVARAGAASV